MMSNHDLEPHPVERVRSASTPRDQFVDAQARLLAKHGIEATSRFVDVPQIGGRAHVLIAGEGPPVVMVIGGGMVGALWAPLMERLDGLTMYAVDPPGAGLSDPAGYRRGSLRSVATGFLEGVLDALELRAAPFVGSSMGGLWSTWLALDLPGRVEAISYIGCPALLLGTSAPLPMRLGNDPAAALADVPTRPTVAQEH
jgi:pimeloyl-ACP methyl ester carboxylesterase